MWVAREWRLQGSQPQSEQRGCPMWCHVGSQHTGQHFAKSVSQNRQGSGLWCHSLCLTCVHHLAGTRSLSVIINVQYWIFILLLPVLTGVSPNPRNRILHLMLLQESVSVYKEKRRSSHAFAFNSGVSTTVLELDQASGLFPPKGRSGQSQTASTSDPFCFSDV